eukprot:3142457-Alexandrium_andersonii.AAC.1
MPILNTRGETRGDEDGDANLEDKEDMDSPWQRAQRANAGRRPASDSVRPRGRWHGCANRQRQGIRICAAGETGRRR